MTLIYFGVEDWQGVLDSVAPAVGAEGIVGDLEGVDPATDEGKEAIRTFLKDNSEALNALGEAAAAADAGDGEEGGEGEGAEGDFGSALKMGLAAVVSVFAVLA